MHRVKPSDRYPSDASCSNACCVPEQRRVLPISSVPPPISSSFRNPQYSEASGENDELFWSQIKSMDFNKSNQYPSTDRNRVMENPNFRLQPQLNSTYFDSIERPRNEYPFITKGNYMDHSMLHPQPKLSVTCFDSNERLRKQHPLMEKENYMNRSQLHLQSKHNLTYFDSNERFKKQYPLTERENFTETPRPHHQLMNYNCFEQREMLNTKYPYIQREKCTANPQFHSQPPSLVSHGRLDTQDPRKEREKYVQHSQSRPNFNNFGVNESGNIYVTDDSDDIFGVSKVVKKKETFRCSTRKTNKQNELTYQAKYSKQNEVIKNENSFENSNFIIDGKRKKYPLRSSFQNNVSPETNQSFSSKRRKINQENDISKNNKKLAQKTGWSKATTSVKKESDCEQVNDYSEEENDAWWFHEGSDSQNITSTLSTTDRSAGMGKSVQKGKNKTLDAKKWQSEDEEEDSDVMPIKKICKAPIPEANNVMDFKISESLDKMIFHEQDDPGIFCTTAITNGNVSCGYIHMKEKACLKSDTTSVTTFNVLKGKVNVSVKRKRYTAQSGTFFSFQKGVSYTLINRSSEEVRLSYFKCI